MKPCLKEERFSYIGVRKLYNDFKYNLDVWKISSAKKLCHNDNIFNFPNQITFSVENKGL